MWEANLKTWKNVLREELPVLVEDTSKVIICTEADAPNHILIEGDNLEALTVLAYTHEGKIDVIYHDPPYNTGNKDFVYDEMPLYGGVILQQGENWLYSPLPIENTTDTLSWNCFYPQNA